MLDLFNLTACRVYGMPDGWEWCRLDSSNAPPGFVFAEGAVPVGIYKRGPRKGRKKWPKQLQTVWIEWSVMQQIANRWETETGLCHKCEGSALETYGWSSRDGEKTRPCKRCSGTGKAVANENDNVEIPNDAKSPER